MLKGVRRKGFAEGRGEHESLFESYPNECSLRSPPPIAFCSELYLHQGKSSWPLRGEAKIGGMSDGDWCGQTLSGHNAGYEETRGARWAGRVLALCHARRWGVIMSPKTWRQTLLRGYRGLRTLADPRRPLAPGCRASRHAPVSTGSRPRANPGPFQHACPGRQTGRHPEPASRSRRLPR